MRIDIKFGDTHQRVHVPEEFAELWYYTTP